MSHIKLKSLEIQGFKSFNDKTVLHFSDAITCVVGPNGCGKSNIVDAIRWVMGEQSAKHLRGREMDDVIFSGSAKREPNSLASVELTFHTEGFPLPVQFNNLAEIAIGRKLYRTGESEYFINRLLVRRKDVTELFLGTGIGTRDYSIIEQGRVEQVIAAKPIDRRTIIEEVAGISKFQVRKEAALRRMESTTQNLVRLQDILSELEKQMLALEKHAKKALKFRKIQDELKSLDLQVASFHTQKLVQRQNDLLARIKELNEKEVALSAKESEGESWVDERRLKLVEAEEKVRELQQLVYASTSSFKLMESKVQNRKEERERCLEQIKNIAVDLHELEAKFLASQGLLAATNERLGFADCNDVLLAEKVEREEKDFEKLAAEGQRLSSLVEKLRHDCTDVAKNLSAIAARRDGLSEKHAQILEKIKNDNEELESLAKKSGELSQGLKKSEEEIFQIKQLKLSLTEKTSALISTLAELKDEVLREQSTVSALKENLLQKKSRLQSLEELQKNFDDYSEGPRVILKRHKNGDEAEVFGSVADMIETSLRYENAVSAVLGEKMQFVVVKGQERGVSCAEYLKASQSGRGTFIPLDVMAEELVPVSMATDNAAVIGKLESFVTVKNGFESLRKFLFGDVVLVATLASALELWIKDRVAAVTLAGEYISTDGTLTGGTLADTSKPLLEKRREAKELNEMVGMLIDEVSEKEVFCLQLSKKIMALELTLDELKTSQHETEVKTAQQEKDILHLQAELENLKQQRGKLSQQIFTSIELKEAVERQMHEQNEQVRSLNESQERAQLAFSENAQLEQSQLADRQRLQGEITQDKINLARARDQSHHLAQEVDRLITEEILRQREIFHLTEQLTLMEKKEIFVSERILFCKKIIELTLQRKAVAEEKYNKQSDEFVLINQDLREREHTIKAVRLEHSTVKDELNKATLELSQLKSNADLYGEQIFAKYNLHLANIYELHLPGDGFDVKDAEEKVVALRESLGEGIHINLAAVDELAEIKERHDFLHHQRDDLEKSLDALGMAIQKINRLTRQRFQDSFNLVNEKFSKLFPRLFQGGNATLKLTDPENILSTGVDIIAQPPGKKLQSISLLSGGEKALTAVSLLFAIFLIKPSPFCLLDEVDAPLDDANVDRYNDIVKEMAQRTQFIVITHNKRTMQMTDSLFGVTMQEPGISTLVAVRIET